MDVLVVARGLKHIKSLLCLWLYNVIDDFTLVLNYLRSITQYAAAE